MEDEDFDELYDIDDDDDDIFGYESNSFIFKMR